MSNLKFRINNIHEDWNLSLGDMIYVIIEFPKDPVGDLSGEGFWAKVEQMTSYGTIRALVANNLICCDSQGIDYGSWIEISSENIFEAETPNEPVLIDKVVN